MLVAGAPSVALLKNTNFVNNAQVPSDYPNGHGEATAMAANIKKKWA